MAFGSVATVLMMGIIYLLLLSSPDSSVNPVLLLVGVLLLLFSELLLVRFIVIPFSGDYGRFRITDTKVDLFPLSRFGFSVLPDPVATVISHYSGVALRVANGRQKGMYYDVFLDHPQRSKTILIRSFPNKAQAADFARELAQTLGLKFIPLE
jgi:hypothetical protein